MQPDKKSLISGLKVLTIVFIIITASSVCKKEEDRIMMVRNDSISDISSTTAKANATIIDIGSGIDQYGHCWSTKSEPTVVENENKTENGTVNSTVSYNSIMTGLLPDTKYFVRAYVQKSSTVVYGTNILSFKTLSIDRPVVTTGTVANVTTSGATVKGNLTSLGAGALSVTQHGHCWSSETTTPTTENDNKSSLGSRDSPGIYESQLVGLSENTLYYVRAYAANNAGTAYGDTISFTTYGQIKAEFDANPKSGYLPLSVQFTDMSTGDINSWSWQFGDEETSTSQNPLHTYDDQGIYSVILTVSNDEGSDTETKNNYITVNSSGSAPIAAFTADKTVITEGETVNFTDQSANEPTSWSWTFGDEGTSTSENPPHTYNTAGTYTVTMTVTNSYGSDTETKNDFITVELIMNTPCSGMPTISDVEGNVYNTVQIGSQCWMQENLKTTKYNNGTNIPLVTDVTAWTNLSTPGYCWYDNDAASYKNTYGALYNWYTVNTGNLCPTGWHVATDSEWTTLTDYLGGESVAGGKLKSTTHWSSPNTGATNESGFTALPGASRSRNGTFSGIGNNGRWWTSTEDDAGTAWRRVLDYDISDIYRQLNDERSGFSVRCVKD